MTTRELSPEAAYAEAVEQLPLRVSQCDRWSDRAVYWAAVRYGVGEIRPGTWPAAAERWTRLWQIARREHLAPIPGVPEVDNLPRDASAADRGLAHMRAIVGKRR
ncbi:hypothetical protein [Cupriavidus numazuensis]|uniref:Uncharacterized protein n=1 Tax=Cupriavidus numazuensis TaxID=221992 RepID=A0ABM8T9K5_9BURK|nr:hypothetical protein [Cupriavidus numazuensis]CAG2129218.1 hypothetical protein LMG26411_00139 [Cupriavidus numazuensis]